MRGLIRGLAAPQRLPQYLARFGLFTLLVFMIVELADRTGAPISVGFSFGYLWALFLVFGGRP